MNRNAYILDWTMDKYDQLLSVLQEKKFYFENEEGKNHIKVEVPFARVEEFGNIIRQHLNAPYNYVDIQYPEEKKTVVIFRDQTFVIENSVQNKEAQEWAISIGLPVEQADWGTSF